jgi:hypothetical protein
LLHSSFTLRLRNNLACVLNYNLVGLKRSHSSYAITTILSVQDFNTIVVSIAFGALFQLGKWSITALFWGKLAVCAVTLIGHDPVVAVFPTAIFYLAVTGRRVLLVLFP